MKRPTLLALLSAALILACWARPTFAQASPAGMAKTPAPAVAQTSPPAAQAAADGFVLAQIFSGEPLSDAKACPTASSPLPEPQIQCFRCPVGFVSCGLPTCRCCRMSTAGCCQ